MIEQLTVSKKEQRQKLKEKVSYTGSSLGSRCVDLFSHTANDKLNEAFKQTYDALAARH